jgi:hypothetical protein
LKLVPLRSSDASALLHENFFDDDDDSTIAIVESEHCDNYDVLLKFIAQMPDQPSAEQLNWLEADFETNASSSLIQQQQHQQQPISLQRDDIDIAMDPNRQQDDPAARQIQSDAPEEIEYEHRQIEISFNDDDIPMVDFGDGRDNDRQEHEAAEATLTTTEATTKNVDDGATAVPLSKRTETTSKKKQRKRKVRDERKRNS